MRLSVQVGAHLVHVLANVSEHIHHVVGFAVFGGPVVQGVVAGGFVMIDQLETSDDLRERVRRRALRRVRRLGRGGGRRRERHAGRAGQPTRRR